MTRPKGKLFALLAIFAAIGLVTASGAFTSVSAERTVTVDVAGDENALLGLTPYDGANGNGGASNIESDGYAQISNDELQINLGGYSAGTPDNQGLNYNASTKFDYVFNVTNNGESDVNFHIDPEGGSNPETVVFYNGTVSSGANVTSSDNPTSLPSGSTASVSIEVDLVGLGSSDVSSPLIESIFINATAA